MTAILEEIEQCARNYIINQCDPETRVPWLETLCNTWQACMKKDPFKGKLSAEIIAEIITSFLEGLSYKAMVRNEIDECNHQKLFSMFTDSFLLVLFYGLCCYIYLYTSAYITLKTLITSLQVTQ